MTGSIRFIARNVADWATLTTTYPPYTTMPVTNLQNPRRGRVFRHSLAGSPTGQTILGTWGGDAYYCSGVALDRVNFSAAAVIQFRGYAASDWTGAPLIDTGVVSAYNSSALGPFTWGTSSLGVAIQDGYLGFKYWIAWFARQQIKSWRIDYNDGLNSDGYNEMGRLVLGDYTEFQRSAQWGLKFIWRDDSTQEASDGGSLFSDGRLPRRAIIGRVPGLEASERTIFADTCRFVGKRKSFLFSIQPGEGGSLERDFTLLQAKFATMPEIEWLLPATHAAGFEIVEA